MTRINFEIKESGMVTMEVFDVKGRRVATVINAEHRTGGPHSAVLNTRGLRSGVYFVKLARGFTSVSRKFVVTR